MVDPIRMVVINLLASILLVSAIIFYIKIYPKKNINLFTLILIISLLPLISIFREGSYESGDLTYHTKFAMQFFENIKQGNIIPAWIDKQCSGYGCPDFIFTFLLSQYLISFIHLLGFSFINSAKILIAVSFILSGIGMFKWIKSELGEKPGFIAAIFYLFAPYHLIDMHFRVSIAEMVAMAILPYLFYTTKRFIETKLFVQFFNVTILFAALILTHQVASMASLPFLLIYALYVWNNSTKKKLRTLFVLFTAYVNAILLTAFYWIPVLVESKLTYYGKFTDIYFHPFSEFIYAPNKFGFLFQGHYGEIYTIIGYTQIFIIFFGLYLLFKNKVRGKDKTLLAGSLIVFIILFLLMQSFTKPFWNLFPILKNFQFSWRLLIQAIIAISIIAAVVVKTYPNKIFFILITFITIFYTILNWGNRGTIPQITDQVLQKQMVFKDFRGQVNVLTPIWVNDQASWIGKIPNKHIEVLTGNAHIVEISRSITGHEYIVLVQSKSLLKENTYYFPGWKLLINNQEKNINYENKQFPGIINFTLDKGLYKVELIFTDTTDRKLAKLISIITSLLFGTIILFRRFLPKRLI